MIPLLKATYPNQTGALFKSYFDNPSQYAATGKMVKTFEQKLARHFRFKYAKAVNSGSAALHLALLALGLKPADEVVIPTYTCVAVLNAVLYVGAKPILVDNEFRPDSMDYNISAKIIRKRLTARTKAVIVPHMFGAMANILEIKKLGLPVIEDATLAFGARDQGRPAGSLGDISVCSFHWSKMMSTGQGGVIASNSKSWAERIRLYSDYEEQIIGMRLKSRSSLNRRGGYHPSYNYGLSDAQALLGISQLKILPQLIRERVSGAKRYQYLILRHGLPVRIPVLSRTRHCVFYRYLVQVKGSPNNIIKKMGKSGIEVGRGIYPPLHYLLQLSPNGFPNAEKSIHSLISLPLYPSLTSKETGYVVEALRRALSRTG